jgi:Xaa-Pro aminopeptidase
MLNDIDAEMKRRGVNGLVVLGDTTLGNPDLTYVVGGSLPRGGIYLKRVGHPPVLLTSNLDIRTARRWGRVKRIMTYTDHGYEKIMAQYGPTDAYPRFIDKILREFGISGRIIIAGRNDLAWGLQLSKRLRNLGRDIGGESSPTILESARETKSSEEINEIQNVGKKTARIANSIIETLQNAKRKRGHLWIGEKRATVGVVKQAIAIELAVENLTAPEGTIFAIGGSSADPHNSGIPSDELREGKLIVFDIFPQAGSGYWFDLTRSFTIGKADNKTRHIFSTVTEAQEASLEILQEGLPADQVMSKACDVIERNGFKTIREVYEGKMRQVQSGFSHSLGHGVGLTIGERPFLTLKSKDTLKRGQVVTVEPGVYIPRLGGVRIEDTVTITKNGYRNLSNVEKILEL